MEEFNSKRASLGSDGCLRTFFDLVIVFAEEARGMLGQKIGRVRP